MVLNPCGGVERQVSLPVPVPHISVECNIQINITADSAFINEIRIPFNCIVHEKTE
jgi:hypothetical protein